MVTRSRAFGLALLVAVLSPGSIKAQWLVDIGAAWGDTERTLDAGVGHRWGPVALVGGVAAVEHGLAPGYHWNDDRTEITDDTGARFDPREVRTTPYVRFWGRLEVQPSWFGGTLMWDPRNHWALGAFGAVELSPGAQALGEVRWVHTLGYVLAFRLRFL